MRQLFAVLVLSMVIGQQMPIHQPRTYPGPIPGAPTQQRTTGLLGQVLLNAGIGVLYGVEKEVKIGNCRQRLNLGQLLEGRRTYSRCRYR